jgi:hypothetical protein
MDGWHVSLTAICGKAVEHCVKNCINVVLPAFVGTVKHGHHFWHAVDMQARPNAEAINLYVLDFHGSLLLSTVNCRRH